MKKLMILALLPLFAAVAPCRAQSSADGSGDAVAYEIDRAHSQIGFQVRHLGIANVRGQFSDYSGEVRFNGDDLSTLQASTEIQAATVDTGVDRRDNDLRSSSFFEVEKYPTITFVSTRVENIEGNTFDLIGDLTMHGVTREVALESEFLGTAGDKAGFSASTTINRKDFGLMWDKVTEAGAIIVSSKVVIMLELELRKR